MPGDDSPLVLKPSLFISAMHSGCGKTLITLLLLYHCKKNRLSVCSFKTGPDYIDPLLHQMVSGIPPYHLDPFFLDEESRLRELFREGSKAFDGAIIEGAMGFYDGIAGREPAASAYSVQRALRSKVVLVVNRSQISALSEYCARYEKAGVCGVLLNPLKEEEYDEAVREIEKEARLPVFGYLPLLDSFFMKSRHLGLMIPSPSEFLKEVGDMYEIAAKTIDFSRLAGLLEPPLEMERGPETKESAFFFTFPSVESGKEDKNKPVTLALARDEAFCFIYEENLRIFEKNDVRISFFSPLADSRLPEEADILWLPGGYPELFAKQLAQNLSLKGDILRKLTQGLPCVAECGGFMYLHQWLEGEDGLSYPMVGYFAKNSFRTKKLGRFGYIHVHASQDNLLLEKGERMASHEFHYWESEEPGSTCLAVKANGSRRWECIHSNERLFAGFPHIYLLSNPKMAARLKNAGLQYRKEQQNKKEREANHESGNTGCPFDRNRRS